MDRFFCKNICERLHFNLVNDQCIHNKYNTTQLWPIQNPSANDPFVSMQSLLSFCLFLLYRSFFLSFAFKSASCLADITSIYMSSICEPMWPAVVNHARELNHLLYG